MTKFRLAVSLLPRESSHDDEKKNHPGRREPDGRRFADHRFHDTQRKAGRVLLPRNSAERAPHGRRSGLSRARAAQKPSAVFQKARAHRQPQRQREDFDNVGTMPPQ